LGSRDSDGLLRAVLWICIDQGLARRRQQARQAAIHQKKQDDCNARLNANSPDAFLKLANIDLCLANPDITVDEAAAGQHQKNLDQVTFDPRAGYTLKHPEGAAAAPDTLRQTERIPLKNTRRHHYKGRRNLLRKST